MNHRSLAGLHRLARPALIALHAIRVVTVLAVFLHGLALCDVAMRYLAGVYDLHQQQHRARTGA